MSASSDVVNEALMMMGGNQPLVTGTAPSFDESTAGKAAQRLYAPAVAFIQRQFAWDASRNTIALTVTGNVAPLPWSFEYGYPTNGIQVWQLMPSVLADLNDPLPVNFIVANAVVNGSQVRVIHTNQANALAVYNNNPGPDVWDAGMRQALVRLLSSEFAIAIGGKPDTSKLLLDSAGTFEQAAEQRQD